MTSLQIGDKLAKQPPTQPLRVLPNRLDASACLNLLARIHPDWTVDSIKAAGTQLDVNEIDSCLEFTALSTSDKILVKSALAEHGFIARGRRLTRG